MGQHANLTDADIHQIGYIQESDPGAVGALKTWFKESTGVLKIRATGNASWVTVVGSGGSTPTGTGFRHVTSGTEDGATKLVDTADINASQVTYAKIQNVSATSRILGRVSSGAGVVEELTGAQVATITSAVTTLDRTTTDVTFSNSAAEQTIYTFSVPGGTLGTTGMLRLTIDSVFLNNTAGQRTFTVKVKYGATTLFEDATGPVNPSATVNIVAPMLLELHADGASTGAQRLRGMMSCGDGNSGAPTTGYGNIGSAPSFTFRPFGGTSSEDSTAAKTLAVTVTVDAATSTFTWHTRAAYLELLK